jgi:predicted transglutaminase-like cysteine proteinase
MREGPQAPAGFFIARSLCAPSDVRYRGDAAHFVTHDRGAMTDKQQRGVASRTVRASPATKAAQVGGPSDENKGTPEPCDVILSAFVHPATAHGTPPAEPARRACVRGRAAWRGWIARAACAGLLLFGVSAAHAFDLETMLRAAQARGPQAHAGARALQGVLASLDGQDEPARLVAINQLFIRRIQFAADTEVWGQVDYWASPLETLAQGRGDCEDYVIAKYFGLLAAGVPVSHLRLVYVRATLGAPSGEVLPHMVLAHYATPGAEPSILDNLVGDIRPASRRRDLEPVFSFNGEGLWQGVGTHRAGDPAARLSRWRDVQLKARAEGFD